MNITQFQDILRQLLASSIPTNGSKLLAFNPGNAGNDISHMTIDDFILNNASTAIPTSRLVKEVIGTLALLSTDDISALLAANSPSGFNSLVTMNDIAYKTYNYKALYTQTGTAAPVARVLNQSDGDFLSIGAIGFAYTNVGVYTLADFFLSYDVTLTSIEINGLAKNIEAIWSKSTNNLVIQTFDTGGSLANGLLTNATIEIIVRLRGEEPILTSLETNEDGDIIILQFDRRMNDYLFTDIGTMFDDGTHTFTVALGSNGTSIEITSSGIYVAEAPIALTYTDTIPIESFDLGLVTGFATEVVTNNVPYIMSAETNITGTKVILMFNRPMGNVDTPTNITLTDGLAAPILFTSVNLGASPNDTIEINLTTAATSALDITLNISNNGIDTAEGTLIPAIVDMVVVNNVPA